MSRGERAQRRSVGEAAARDVSGGSRVAPSLPCNVDQYAIEGGPVFWATTLRDLAWGLAILVLWVPLRPVTQIVGAWLTTRPCFCDHHALSPNEADWRGGYSHPGVSSHGTVWSLKVCHLIRKRLGHYEPKAHHIEEWRAYHRRMANVTRGAR